MSSFGTLGPIVIGVVLFAIVFAARMVAAGIAPAWLKRFVVPLRKGSKV